MASFKSFLIPVLLVTLSSSCIHVTEAARHLLPDRPALLPPLPGVPRVPLLPPLPGVPRVPLLPLLPPLPGIPLPRLPLPFVPPVTIPSIPDVAGVPPIGLI
ncbi:hypothetical protein SDJN03_17370, partial [Cucurbita argyrosperma subsp. sororia]